MKHQCKICGKKFDKKESLGGHVSSHNRGESYKKGRSKGKSKRIRKKSEGPWICEYCGNEFSNGWKLGGHKTLCKMNPKREERLAKIAKSGIGRKHSEFSKSLISESMEKAHKDGRAWNIGKSRWNNEKSYPEEFFERVIENNFLDKEYETEYPVSIYAIDFAWVNKKKAIEIDGEQHQRFEEYIERDKRKDQSLIEEGWQILRIKWKDMFNNPKYWIQEAYKFIH